MTEIDRLDRELTAWFSETAAPRVPDYVDDIVRQAAPLRQRPRWTFPARWIPMTIIAFSGRTGRPVPWRAIGVLALVGLLIGATVAIYVGTRPRVPAPFGRAANGVIAEVLDGDIVAVDPTSGVARPVITGPTVDHDPRYSRDGTRVAFLRDVGNGMAIVVADTDGRDQRVVSEPFATVDPDGIMWSPDGHWIAASATPVGQDSSHGLYLVDTTDGGSRALSIDYAGIESYWRPPDGRTLLFHGNRNGVSGLFLVTPETGAVEALPTRRSSGTVRPLGWAPDGTAVLYRLDDEPDDAQTYVLDLSTRQETVLPVAFGRISNDGHVVAGVVGDQLCVMPVTGGDCRSIGAGGQAPDGTSSHTWFWSPDDQAIVISRGEGRRPILIDTVTGRASFVAWLGSGPESWQRVAP
jgi:Tol biopolymer transport system component